MSDRDRLLAEIEAFLKSEGMNPTDFGRGALNDTAFVSRLRNGSDVRSKTAAKVREFMVASRKRRRAA